MGTCGCFLFYPNHNSVILSQAYFSGVEEPAFREAVPAGNLRRATFVSSIGPIGPQGGRPMVKFLLWCILFVLCWPLALLALVLYPLVWLLLLPFRLVGIAVGGVLELVSAIILLPARVLRAI